MKLLLGVLLSNLTSALIFVFMFFIPYSKMHLAELTLIMFILYAVSAILILGSVDQKCSQAYLDGYADGDHSSRNTN